MVYDEAAGIPQSFNEDQTSSAVSSSSISAFKRRSVYERNPFQAKGARGSCVIL